MSERTERCETCRFWWREKELPTLAEAEIKAEENFRELQTLHPEMFAEEDKDESIEDDVRRMRHGGCRRLPPQLIVWPSLDEDDPGEATCDARWPLTDPEDWCGEWSKE